MKKIITRFIMVTLCLALPMFTFGKEGTDLGEFEYPFSLAIKANLLYVADTGNDRIQILEIKY